MDGFVCSCCCCATFAIAILEMLPHTFCSSVSRETYAWGIKFFFAIVFYRLANKKFVVHVHCALRRAMQRVESGLIGQNPDRNMRIAQQHLQMESKPYAIHSMNVSSSLLSGPSASMSTRPCMSACVYVCGMPAKGIDSATQNLINHIINRALDQIICI